MSERVVRIIRVWDVPVAAEYGDTDEALVEKASAGAAGDSSETKVILPESQVALSGAIKQAVQPETGAATSDKGKE